MTKSIDKGGSMEHSHELVTQQDLQRLIDTIKGVDDKIIVLLRDCSNIYERMARLEGRVKCLENSFNKLESSSERGLAKTSSSIEDIRDRADEPARKIATFSTEVVRDVLKSLIWGIIGYATYYVAHLQR